MRACYVEALHVFTCILIVVDNLATLAISQT